MSSKDQCISDVDEKDEECGQRQIDRTGDDDEDISTVSTHSSMPSLMSDNTSEGESLSDNDSESNDNDGNPCNINDNFAKNQESQKKKNAKKVKNKHDDFLSGFGAGFLAKKKGKKQTQKAKKKKKKQTKKPNANKTTKNAQTSKPVKTEKNDKDNSQSPTTANESALFQIDTVSKNNDKVNGVYRLIDSDNDKITACKDAKGNILLAINVRKVSCDLSEFTYLRCIVSLKNRLRKKKQNESEYNAVLIDCRRMSDAQRQNVRSELVKGYENVLSFVLNIAHIIRLDEKSLDLDEALLQYQEKGIFINTRPVTTPKNEMSESEQKETHKPEKTKSDKIETKSAMSKVEEKDVKIANLSKVNEIVKISKKESLKTVKSENNMPSKPIDTSSKNALKSDKKEPAKREKAKISKKTQPKVVKIELKAPKPSKQSEQKEAVKLDNSQNAKLSKNESLKSVKSQNKIASKPKVVKKELKPTKPSKSEQKEVVKSAKNESPKSIKSEAKIPQNDEQKEDNDKYKYLTADLMNKVRLNQSDFIGDTALNDKDVNGYFVRIRGGRGKKTYSVQVIKDTMHYPTKYKFKSMKISKGLQVYNGKKIINQRVSKISNDKFTQNEIGIFKESLSPFQIPNEQELNDQIIKLQTIRSQIAQKIETKSTELTQIDSSMNDLSICQQPGSMQPPSSQRLNAKALAKLNEQNGFEKELKRRYDEAISAGYHCFWMIPRSQNNDSKYVAFLLAKSKKNQHLLQESQDRARRILSNYGQNVNEVKFVVIREWRDNGSKNALKCKGWILDCKQNEIAMQIKLDLECEIFPKETTFPIKTKICRLVENWFGRDFMKIQCLPKRKKPEDARKPHGPKTDYSQIGEPSIIAMSECPEKVFYGEFDHSEVATSAVFDFNDQSDVHSVVSDVSHTTNQTVARYDDIMHMKHPQKYDRFYRFHVGDRVLYNEQECDVFSVNDNSLILESSDRRFEVFNNEYNCVRHI